MKKVTKLTLDLFEKREEISYVDEIKENIFIIPKICRMTGFCIPLLRRKHGLAAINFELGITALHSDKFGIEDLLINLRNGNFVSLPKSVPSEFSLETIIYDNRVSDWLIEYMVSVSSNYCLDRSSAVDIINRNDERFLCNLQRLFPIYFEEAIKTPLGL